jgi:hypothetical protein
MMLRGRILKVSKVYDQTSLAPYKLQGTQGCPGPLVLSAFFFTL